MAERDQTPVTITLDRQRPYRVNESDRVAVWVGPGRVVVPAWVAEHWGMEPELVDHENPKTVADVRQMLNEQQLSRKEARNSATTPRSTHISNSDKLPSKFFEKTLHLKSTTGAASNTILVYRFKHYGFHPATLREIIPDKDGKGTCILCDNCFFSQYSDSYVYPIIITFVPQDSDDLTITIEALKQLPEGPAPFSFSTGFGSQLAPPPRPISENDSVVRSFLEGMVEALEEASAPPQSQDMPSPPHDLIVGETSRTAIDQSEQEDVAFDDDLKAEEDIYVPERGIERDQWVSRWAHYKVIRGQGKMRLADLEKFLANHYPNLTCSRSTLSRNIKAGKAGKLDGP